MHLCIVLLRQPTMANASSGTELAQANSTASPSQFHKQCYLLGALLLAVSLLLGLRLTVAAGDISPLDLSRHALITQKPEGSFQPAIQHGDDDENPAGSDEIELEGSILSAPDHTQGYGEWTIRALSGRIYRVIADSETEFRPQLPAIGQSVKVKGRLRNRDQGDEIVATRVEIEDEREDESKPDELQGILVSAPSDGIGTWIVQTGFTQTISIVVDSTTRLDDGVPPAGRWLEVRGRWQTDNTFLAARIRVEDHRINEVVVRLTQNVVSTTVASRYGLLPKETLIRSGNIHLFVTQEDEEHNIVTKLTADPDVLWAELNYVGGIPEGHGYKTWRWGGTTADGYVNQGAFDQVNLAPALTAYRGKDVIVAVLDTGINQAHKAFVGRLLPGYDMVDDDADPEDEGDGVGWGHGTHVAGIIAQVSPQSKLLPVRVLNSNGRGNTFALAYAIEWSVEQGADVINLSLGADTNSRVLNDVISDAVAHGVIIVAAAGNVNSNEPQYPASLPGVFSVTAVDERNAKADFASYGAGWVDIAAPGVGITSTIVGPFGSGYASWSGTSMATGFVSGAAALMRQQQPQASVATIEKTFTTHTRDLDRTNPTYAGQLGGLLDVAAALAVDDPVATPTPAPTPTPTPTSPDPTAGEVQLFLPYVQR